MKSMKRVFVTMLLLMAAATATMAQATPPALINYQGVLRDRTTGQPLTATVNLVFTFYPDAGSTGTGILSDTHAGVVVSGGLFSVQLGGGTLADGAGPGSSGSLSDVMRDFSDVWMEVKAGSETLTPRVRVVGAPYAMNATHLEGKRAVEFIDRSGSYQGKAGGFQAGYLSSVYGFDVGGFINDYGTLAVASDLNANGPISGK